MSRLGMRFSTIQQDLRIFLVSLMDYRLRRQLIAEAASKVKTDNIEKLFDSIEEKLSGITKELKDFRASEEGEDSSDLKPEVEGMKDLFRELIPNKQNKLPEGVAEEMGAEQRVPVGQGVEGSSGPLSMGTGDLKTPAIGTGGAITTSLASVMDELKDALERPRYKLS
jgi:hypothetical protein